MNRNLNQNQIERDKILGISPLDKYIGGCARFNGLSLERLERLIEGGFIDLDERQNNAPTIREFVRFLRKYPKFKVHGYAVSKDRQDYRISIEAIEYFGRASKEIIEDFIGLFSGADELINNPDHLYAWWD